MNAAARWSRLACAGGVLAALGGCGKRGDPLAPLPRTPQAVTGLAVAQRGRQVEVTYVAPRMTTGGAGLPVLDVEILRAESEGDFLKVARGQSRKAAPGETLRETAPLPPPGTHLRVAARARAGGHLSALTPVVALAVQAPLAPPSELKAQLTARGVSLAWTAPPGGIPPPIVPSPSPSPSASPPLSSRPVSTRSPVPPASAPSTVPSVAPTPPPSPTPVPTPAPPSSGYWVYRREPGGAYRASLVAAPLQVAAFEDTSATPGQNWCYVARLVAATEPVIESDSSNEVCLAVKDVAAPAAPTGVAVLVRDGAVELSWSPSSEPDLAVYRVYRAGAGAGAGAAAQRIAEVAAGETTFRDAGLEHGAPHLYTVTAVDNAGNESPPSAPAEGSVP